MGKSTDIVKALYDAFGKGDVPAVLGAFELPLELQLVAPLAQVARAPGYVRAHEGSSRTGEQGTGCVVLVP